MSVHPLAGKVAPYEVLINVPRLISAYYTHQPDPGDPAQRVAFGTSGHRGSSLDKSFNEVHILAISQAIAELRQSQGITGPLYLGMDTYALSEPALYTAIEVFAANRVETFIQQGLGYTPTPVISHTILAYNHGRTTGLADGVVITPSHKPPADGGFKYNPPAAGPAEKAILSNLSPERVKADELAGDRIIAKPTKAPYNDAAIGGLKVVTQNGWFAARPSGTEDVYKVYAESFISEEHLGRIQAEAQAMVDAALKTGEEKIDV
jgi:phosphoglucomutase